MRQLAPLFGISKSAADRITGRLGPSLALQPRKRFREDAVLNSGRHPGATRDHTVAEQSKNDQYSTNHQVVIDADTRLVVAVGPAGARQSQRLQGVGTVRCKAPVGPHHSDRGRGYRGTGLVIPHRRQSGQAERPAWKEEHNASHRKVRTRVEHAFARMIERA